MTPEPLLVVLAAGAGRRLGQVKALCQLGRHTALEHVLRAGLDSALECVIVLGAEAERVQSALPAGPRVLINTDWNAGRTGSLQLAARAFPERDLLVAPVDVPLVHQDTHRRLRTEWASRARPEHGWLAPGYRVSSDLSADVLERANAGDRPTADQVTLARSGQPGAQPPTGLIRGSSLLRPGHPILIGRGLALRLLELDADQPLRDLRAMSQPLWMLDCGDPGVLDDLDTPADALALCARLAQDQGGE
jgi:CTP:molybdopterin cytidylyltransferase MocA